MLLLQRITVKDFDLASTVESGQLFRWQKQENGYVIAHRDELFYAEQKGNTLSFRGTTKKYIKNFFGLNIDYAAIKKTLAHDSILRKAVKAYPGIHLVNQDPWECTISFLCSSFSNIKKIQLNLRKIVECFGIDGAFPVPGTIDNHHTIKACSTGYRSAYIFAVNSKVDDAYFARLRKKSYADAKDALMELPGIGPKVADCICLFSLGFTEAFPVDVWVQRFMQESYGVKKEKEIRVFAAKKWGKLAGYFQQYLYHWRRLQ